MALQGLYVRAAAFTVVDDHGSYLIELCPENAPIGFMVDEAFFADHQPSAHPLEFHESKQQPKDDNQRDTDSSNFKVVRKPEPDDHDRGCDVASPKPPADGSIDSCGHVPP